jgi:hypothetical protein
MAGEARISASSVRNRTDRRLDVITGEIHVADDQHRSRPDDFQSQIGHPCNRGTIGGGEDVLEQIAVHRCSLTLGPPLTGPECTRGPPVAAMSPSHGAITASVQRCRPAQHGAAA